MLIRPAIGDTDPIRYRRPTPDSQFSGNIIDEAMRPTLEWAPRGGRVGFQQLTGRPGFQRMKAHGKASNPQRRVQTAGVTGVSERRDAARALEAAQCLP